MDKWVSIATPNPAAPTRLFCFPYAGGGASAYREWHRWLPQVEVAAVQLPGRENRLGERPVAAMDRLLDLLVEALDPLLRQRPFAFFGHSMGARIAYALTRRLEQDGAPLPSWLFASGSPAPWLRIPEAAWAEPDDRLLAWLADLGGTPPEVLDSPDLMQLALPVIRADLTLGATWQYPYTTPSSVPVHAFAATDDDYATPERARAWDRETTGPCRVSVFPGGHFFLHEHTAQILRLIDEDLLSVAR
ncbi:thioesterase [Micromonospora fiedleri]|uniref:Thioesterase n=1 Tax=Micromonospora fiedleri TaxID=1157498 RepID=A0ABS1UTR1_9ACTN|nr:MULTISPECIES: alpha/beta fold hydrolase [Micromonospora]MBL6279727.1 thioesterase [Micromonospora fiedleri]WSK40943.1 alpha/beta fold hydrolase [Micromonospora maris]